MLKTISNSMILTLLLILLVVTVVMVAIIVILPKLVAKGVNVANSIATAKSALTVSTGILKAADTFLPNNPAVDILQTIETYATKAVKASEQLYLSSKLAADERNAKAKEIVNSALTVLNVEITPSISKVIDGAIEAEVLVLPKVAITDVQKQAEKVALQTTNTQLQAQNTQLNQSLSQLKTAVSNIQ